MIQTTESKSRMRIPIAPSSPIRLALPRLWKLARQDRNKDDVVDAEYDLKERQRDEREQTGRSKECVHSDRSPLKLSSYPKRNFPQSIQPKNSDEHSSGDRLRPLRLGVVGRGAYHRSYAGNCV